MAAEWHDPESSNWLPRIRVREGSRVRHRFWQPGGGYERDIYRSYDWAWSFLFSLLVIILLFE